MYHGETVAKARTYKITPLFPCLEPMRKMAERMMPCSMSDLMLPKPAARSGARPVHVFTDRRHLKKKGLEWRGFGCWISVSNTMVGTVSHA